MTTEDTKVAAEEQLQSFVERLENLEEELKEKKTEKKEVFSEAKLGGFDVKALREVLKLRKKDRSKMEEFQDIVELYMSKLKS